MSLVKARCCDCDQIHIWFLANTQMKYPEGFTGDKRVLLTRSYEGDPRVCLNDTQLTMESKVEHAPAS